MERIKFQTNRYNIRIKKKINKQMLYNKYTDNEKQRSILTRV